MMIKKVELVPTKCKTDLRESQLLFSGNVQKEKRRLLAVVPVSVLPSGAGEGTECFTGAME
ncbi:MAG: hypothetical protein CSB34_03080 [Desulfobulbus propionicus]|nr:MAG: hypothetical protein CSB34_03080 [Desulfobulbus propionicus]